MLQSLFGMAILIFCISHFSILNDFMKKKLAFFLLLSWSAFAQTQLPLNDLSSFKPNTTGNWKIVGNASADISKENVLNTTPGTGVLACFHEKGKYGREYDLFSNFEHGDLDVELDYMLTKGSNSGIYLQGRYEIQLFDSWGKKTAKYSDAGGIYERWNEAMPEGQKGYEGYAPRVNVSKAPGLWQKIKISFQAPKFDAAGKKIANARIISIKLNGITVHENVELSGVTRGAMTENEVAMGPLRIQGDHGSLAIKDIKITNFDKKPGTLSDLTYKVYYGSYQHDTDLSTLKVDERGKIESLTWEVTKNPNDYAFVIRGKYTAPTDGNYTFKLQESGHSWLKIDNKEVLDNQWFQTNTIREVSVDLKAGDHIIEIFNNKRDGWMKPVLAFWSSGPGFRETPHHAVGSLIAGKLSDPIIVSASNNTTLRSFMDFKKPEDKSRFRIVHAISVGTPDNLHYTYDLDKGALVQVWKGGFLDATPMWNDRGDGSSRPLGSVTLLNHDLLLADASAAAWPKDTTGSGYKPLGYDLDDADLPTFKYKIFGADVSDAIRIVDGKYFSREVNIKNPAKSVQARLAEGKQIEKVEEGLYAVDNKSYFIKIDTGSGATIKSTANGQELVATPSNGKIIYSLLF